jgi:NIMA (never in mitosis gene a)-related kinase
VLKEVDTTLMSPEEQKSAIFEAKILSKINSEYVCKYFDSFMDDCSINIIMEHCESGDL